MLPVTSRTGGTPRSPQEAAATAGVDQVPAAKRRLPSLPRIPQHDPVRPWFDFNGPYGRSIPKFSDLLPGPGQVILEAPPVKLVGGDWEYRAGPNLVVGGHIAVDGGLAPAEQAQAELAKLFPLQILLQTKPVGQVVRGDLDRGFADLVRSLRYRKAPALDHGDVEIGQSPAEMAGEGQACKPPAHNAHVAAFHGISHASHNRRPEAARLRNADRSRSRATPAVTDRLPEPQTDPRASVRIPSDSPARAIPGRREAGSY